jgi:hypothetical protein
MRDTDRAAMEGRLEAVERVIESVRHVAPYHGELDNPDWRDAARRIDRLLRDAIREALVLRGRIRLPTDEERVSVGSVAATPEAVEVVARYV